LEVMKNQIKFFIERRIYMKKVICLFSAFLLLLLSSMTTYAHETNSQDNLSIPIITKHTPHNQQIIIFCHYKNIIQYTPMEKIL